MTKHPVDLSAAIAYVAGGGLAGVAAFLAVVYPGHSALFISGGVALACAAGLLRVMFNPTPSKGTEAVTTTTNPVTPFSLTTNTEQESKP